MFSISSANYSNYPNLLLIVNKSKKIEDNEMIKPNIINGLDLTFSCSLRLLLEEACFLSFLERRLGKGLITIKFRFKFITLMFGTNLYDNQQHFDNLLQV